MSNNTMCFHTRSRNVNLESGTLLVEMLVALFLVSVALTVVVNSFLTSQDAYRIADAQARLADGLAFALADISREARVSKDFRIESGGFGMTRIAGVNEQASDEQVVYTLNAGHLMKRVGAATALPITPPAVGVETFTVEIITDEVTRARFVLVATSTEEVGAQRVYLQTTLTERVY